MGFGPHVMLDLNECNPNQLNSVESCFKLLDELPTIIGMTKITMPYVFPYEGLVPEDKGITGNVIIAESHVSIHTFSLKNYAFIDIFSCKPFDSKKAINYCIDFYNTNINCYSVRCEGTVFIYSKSDNDRCFRRSEKRCPGKYAK